jgi:hypothetical protein
MNITEQEFEILPKEEQTFRWALFLKSNGYTKQLDATTVSQLREKYVVRKEKLDKRLFG